MCYPRAADPEAGPEPTKPRAPDTKERDVTSDGIDREAKIIRYNTIAAVLHLVQGIIMLGAAFAVEKFKNFKLPVDLYYLAEKSEGGKSFLAVTSKQIGLLPIGPLVSVFFLLSALFHFIVISSRFKQTYLEGLREGRNSFRWIEYSISSSIMIWLIAQFFGVTDISLLFSIFVMNAVMNLCGLLMEDANAGVRHDDTPVKWLPFVLGTILGATTWIVVFIYFFGSGPSSEIPGFVYGVIMSYFVFFNTFPVNMILVYKRVGRWESYMFGEFVYIVLSLFSKTLLGWLVFGGLNQPNQYT